MLFDSCNRVCLMNKDSIADDNVIGNLKVNKLFPSLRN